MTTEDLQQTEELIRDLVGTYTSKSEELELERKEHLGAVYFRLRSHGDDMSVLTGREGTHVRALAAIVREIGKTVGTVFVLDLREPHTPRSRDVFARVASPKQYDTSTAEKVLSRILYAIGIGDFKIEASFAAGSKHGPPPTVRFRIYLRGEDDYGKLVARSGADANGPGETIVGAIGTLFRAYAQKDGVKFTLEVVRP